MTGRQFTVDPDLNSLFPRLHALPVIAARDGPEASAEIARQLLGRIEGEPTRLSEILRTTALAFLHGHLGDADETVRYLEERHRAGVRDNPWFWYGRNGILAPVSDAPEFRAFLAELKQAASGQLRLLRDSGREPEPPGA